MTDNNEEYRTVERADLVPSKYMDVERVEYLDEEGFHPAILYTFDCGLSESECNQKHTLVLLLGPAAKIVNATSEILTDALGMNPQG